MLMSNTRADAQDRDEDGGETTDSDVVVIDGEQHPRDEVAFYLENGPKWRAKMTQQEQALSEKERAIAEREARAAAREAAIEELKAQPVKREPEGKVEQKVETDELLEPDFSDLPNQLDDPAAYNQALARKFQQSQKQLADNLRKQAQRDLEAERQRTSERVKQVEESGKTNVARQRVLDTNRRLVDEYYAAHPEITAPEKSSIERKLNSSLRDVDYGQQDPSGAFRYNTAAVEAADRLVRSKHYEQLAKDQGYEEGLTQREKAGRASRVNGRSSGRAPGKNASPEEIWTASNKFAPDSRQHREFFDALSDAQIDAYMAYVNENAEELGG